MDKSQELITQELIEARKSKKISQRELAKRAGCTRQTIIALEQGKYVPSIELAFRIAEVFGVSLEEVFQYKESS